MELSFMCRFPGTCLLNKVRYAYAAHFTDFQVGSCLESETFLSFCKLALITND